MKKNILVVDDSALMRRVVCDIINADSNFEALETARNGKAALEKLRVKKYDGVVLDVNMPIMDGIQLLEALQKEKIVATIIMVSTLTTKDADVTIRAMELGAVDFVTKPENIIEAKGREFAERLLVVLNAVIRTSTLSRNVSPIPKPVKVVRAERDLRPAVGGNKKLIALASSTGGPKALQSVVPFLPKNMDCPMVIVQHMPAGFTNSMAKRLDELSEVSVKEAEDGDILKKGWVYIAPGGKHFKIVASPDGTHRIKLSHEPPISGLRPCADIMYESLETSKFDQITCVVLTGMGSDGTKGIKGLSGKKKIYTIAQNMESCVVYGMPKAISEAGLVNEVVSLDKVANSIVKNVGVS